MCSNTTSTTGSTIWPLFEIGRVFLQEKDAHIEARRLSMAWTGKIESSFWKEGFKGRSLDIFDAKGTIEVFLDQFGMRGLGWRHEACTSTDFMVEKGSLILGKHVLGSLGQLHPGIAKEYDIKSEVFLCELDLDRLLSMRVRQRSFKALPTFPSIRRDLAMLVFEETTHAEIEKPSARRSQCIWSRWMFSTCSAANTSRKERKVWATV